MRKAKHTEGEEYEKALDDYRSICAGERENVLEAGGLHILGTERHESRRIDNQLRGRSGRQGDPGSSRFFLSLDDDLMRIFGSEKISGLMEKLGMTEGQEIENRMVSKAIENAQARVEGHNFDIRKHLLEYDDVMNKQREVVYGQRREILNSEDLSEWVSEMAADVLAYEMDIYIDPKAHGDEWDTEALSDRIYSIFGVRPDEEIFSGTVDEIYEALTESVQKKYADKEVQYGPDLIRHLERIFLLQILDTQWKDHLYNMDQLRDGIGLRGYGQRDPLSEYKIEGFGMFSEVMDRVREETVKTLYMVQISQEEEDLPARRQQRMVMGRGDTSHADEKPRTVRREGKKVGRNEPCPCGSGKKYKKCCGAV